MLSPAAHDILPPDDASRGGLQILPDGPSAPRKLWESLSSEILRGGTTILVCADNRFQPDFLIIKARQAGRLPEEILSRLHIARAFTIYQLLSIVSERLEAEILRTRSTLVAVSGLLPLFSDAAVPSREAFGILEQLLVTMNRISRQGVRILIPVEPTPSPSRRTRNILLRIRQMAVPADQPPGGG
uniref:DNA recombination and repair protein Rad51-like C-terminal domain-containing protein n=1 Tax=Leptospirillum ferriphilum TaxID=178606 RepID=A0A7C3LTY8_9BACT